MRKLRTNAGGQVVNIWIILANGTHTPKLMLCHLQWICANGRPCFRGETPPWFSLFSASNWIGLALALERGSNESKHLRAAFLCQRDIRPARMTRHRCFCGCNLNRASFQATAVTRFHSVSCLDAFIEWLRFREEILRDRESLLETIARSTKQVGRTAADLRRPYPVICDCPLWRRSIGAIRHSVASTLTRRAPGAAVLSWLYTFRGGAGKVPCFRQQVEI